MIEKEKSPELNQEVGAEEEMELVISKANMLETYRPESANDPAVAALESLVEP